MLVAGRDLRIGQLDPEFFTDVNAKNVSLKLILPKGWWRFCSITYVNRIISAVVVKFFLLI